MDFWLTILAAVVVIVILSCIVLKSISWLTVWPVRSRDYLLKKRYQYNPKEDALEFPSLLCVLKGRLCHTEPSLYLSIVIPAMNEETRLPNMLEECFSYLSKRAKAEAKFTFEIIVVDDGSTDGTAAVALEYASSYSSDVVRVLKLEQNLGKGGAVRNGVLCCRGKLILFVDADGATRFADFENLERELILLTTLSGCLPKEKTNFDWTFPAVAVGSRAHLEKESIAKRSLARTILMIGFHTLVWLFAVRSVRDTQCGFKLFTRSAAAKLFSVLHVERWAFDAELLYLAEYCRYPVCEVPVSWHEVNGSKIIPVLSWMQMGRDLILIWFRYYTGAWKAEI